MWKLIQYLIVSAVVVSNAAWEWTQRRGLVGIGVAFCFTVVVIRIADVLRSMGWVSKRSLDGIDQISADGPLGGIPPPRRFATMISRTAGVLENGLMGIGLSFVVTVAVARLADALRGITR